MRRCAKTLRRRTSTSCREGTAGDPRTIGQDVSDDGGDPHREAGEWMIALQDQPEDAALRRLSLPREPGQPLLRLAHLAAQRGEPAFQSRRFPGSGGLTFRQDLLCPLRLRGQRRHPALGRLRLSPEFRPPRRGLRH